MPEDKRDYSFSGRYRADINLHIGNIGTTPKTGYPVNSNAPSRTGIGNDNIACRVSTRVGVYENSQLFWAPAAASTVLLARMMVLRLTLFEAFEHGNG